MNGEKAAEAQDEQLPRFDGDPTAAEKWLNDFEKLSAASSTRENDKLESVASCFTGLALEWFVERDEAFQSWSELREEFLVRFLRPEAPQADAYVRLRRLIQDDKTDFCAHLIEVLRLCHIAHPYMTEKEQISWFMKSVRPDYRPALVLSGIDSLNTLRDKCALIDTVEPFRNEIALKSKIPFVRRATPSSSSKSNVTFATKEVQTVQTMRRSEPLPNHAGGDNRPPRRSFKPYCNHCARFGHTTRNCYALGRR